MELFLGLGIIVAISELREWRQHKNTCRIVDAFEALELSNKLETLKIDEFGKSIEKVIKNIEDLQLRVHALNEMLQDQKDKIEKAEANTATILKEYELNGIPLGLQRKNADYIEGL